ncbi:MAG: carboxymuconolactone decarboxylase family protein, partial [Gammaproteobacteria bacterium]|nr:carboxymuconolactone decarboxylase family protein [Gammaproteobacteria bacterium]
MSNTLKEFKDYRAKMNERILSEDNRVIKRVFSVDSLVYTADSSLSKSTKELLG